MSDNLPTTSGNGGGFLRAANDTFLHFLERAATDPAFDINKFAAVLDAQGQMLREMQRQAFNRAMASTQRELEPVSRDAPNPAFRSRYATLGALDAMARPIYTKHGLSLRYGTADSPRGPEWQRVTCTVAHDDGYEEVTALDAQLAAPSMGRQQLTGPQAVGYVVTFLRRYLLSMVFNLITIDVLETDNDGGRTTDRVLTTTVPPVTKGAPLEAQPPAGRRRSIGEWITDYERRLKTANSLEETRAIIAEEETARVRSVSKNGALTELNRVEGAALARWAAPPKANGEDLTQPLPDTEALETSRCDDVISQIQNTKAQSVLEAYVTSTLVKTLLTRWDQEHPNLSALVMERYRERMEELRTGGA